MNQTFTPTDGQMVFMDTIEDATYAMFWPVQLVALPILYVAYRRLPRTFMLLLLISHMFSLIRHGLMDPKVHCWIMKTFHFSLQPTTVFTLAVWGSVAWFFFYATRVSAIVLCGLYLIQTRKAPNQPSQPIAGKPGSG
jgi:uncharacterized membrane-anchored protein YitT (DUF2179 family)